MLKARALPIDDDSLAFLQGGGAMGELIRSRDWQHSELGPPEHWPTALKSAISSVLNSGTAMHVSWGENLLQFYNDAYTPILTGGKHPAALGLSVRDSFPEIWDFIWPLFDRVLNNGESVAMENAGLVLYRDGRLQESFFSFSYSPLKSLAGKVCGVTTVCWETSEEVIIKRREHGLRLLTEQLAAATTLEDVHNVVRSHVEGNRGDLPLLLWYERDELLKTLRLVMSCGISGEAPLIRELGAQDGRSELGQAIDSTAPVARLLCLPEPATEWLLDAPSAMEVESVAIESLCYVNHSTPDAYLVFGVSQWAFDASNKSYLESICHGVERAVRRISAVELERRENLRQFAEVTAIVPSLVWMTDADGACTFVSKRWLDFTGRTELESLADAWKSGIHSDDQADVEDARRVALANRAPLNMQYRFLRADGQYRWMMVEALPRHDDRGNFLGMVGSSLDITERKQAQLEAQEANRTLEQALVELEQERQRLLAAQRVAKVGSWETDLATGRLMWSDETHRIHETQPGDFVPTYELFLQMVHPDDRERLDKALADSIQGDGVGVVEHRLLLPTGHIKYVEKRWQIKSDATGTPVRAIGTCQDVSERERAESVIRNTSDRLALATQSAQIGIWDWDVLSNTLVWDAQMLRLYGLGEGGFGEGYKVWALSLHPDDRERVLTEVSDAVAGIRDYDSQFRILLPDGQLRYIEASGLVQRAADGTALRMIGVNRDVSEQTQAESVLRNLGDRLSLATQSAQVGIWDWILVDNTLIWDAQMLRLYGLDDVELVAVYEAWVQCLHPDDRERIQAQVVDAVAGIREYHARFRIIRPDGQLRDIEANGLVQRAADGTALRMIGTNRDISEQMQTNRSIRYLNRVLAMTSSINALIVRAGNRDELFKQACRIAVQAGGFQFAIISVVVPGGLDCVAMAGENEDEIELIRQALAKTGPAPSPMAARVLQDRIACVSNASQSDPQAAFPEMQVRLGIQSIAIIPLLVDGAPVGVMALSATEGDFFQAEEIALLTELAGDIALAVDRLDARDQLAFLAYYDALTGLANRSLFLERVGQYARSAARGGGQLAVLIFDLERFKNINESLGRDAGDKLLRQVASWLTGHVGDVNLLARIDADHFGIVFPASGDSGDIARAIEHLMAVFLRHSFEIDGETLRIAARAGIAMYPADGQDAEVLFEHAEAALKKANVSGARYLFYAQQMTDAVAGRLALESQLRHALENEEFVLHYQPKVDLSSGLLTGAEALIRWNHPRTGLMPPARFIPILEETGMINEVGHWALQQAISDWLRWRRSGLPAVPIAVNVSTFQLRDPAFVSQLKRVIGVDKDAAQGLELEITESMIMGDVQQSIVMLQAIREMGICVAIDDFGTGFSSLGYLGKLPIDTLKIDRSFIADMDASVQGASLIATMLTLAKSLRLKVVAEGVETAEQARLLRLLQCNEMQGYLISPALGCAEFEERFLVTAWRMH